MEKRGICSSRSWFWRRHRHVIVRETPTPRCLWFLMVFEEAVCGWRVGFGWWALIEFNFIKNLMLLFRFCCSQFNCNRLLFLFRKWKYYNKLTLKYLKIKKLIKLLRVLFVITNSVASDKTENLVHRLITSPHAKVLYVLSDSTQVAIAHIF